MTYRVQSVASIRSISYANCQQGETNVNWLQVAWYFQVFRIGHDADDKHEYRRTKNLSGIYIIYHSHQLFDLCSFYLFHKASDNRGISSWIVGENGG